MRTPILAAAAVLAILAAGGGYYALQIYPQRAFRDALDKNIATLPPGVTVTYKDAVLSVPTKRATITGLVAHIPGDQTGGPVIDVTVDSLEVAGPNMAFDRAWRDSVANKAGLTPEAVLRAADQVMLRGIDVKETIGSDTAISAHEEYVRLDEPRLYPWALLHDGTPVWGEAMAALIQTKPGTPPDFQKLLRIQAAWILGIGHDAYEAGPLAITEHLPNVDMDIAIKKMTAGSSERGVMKSFLMENLTMKGLKTGGFAVDRVSFDGVDVRDPATRIVNGAPVTLALLDKMSIGRISYEGFDVAVPGKQAIHLGGITVGPMTFAQGWPVTGVMSLTDFRVPAEMATDPQARANLKKFGLDVITVSFALAYDWNLGTQQLTIHDTSLKVAELGTLKLSADLTNIVPNAGVMFQARLGHATLRFDDASLVDRALRDAAANAGTDPAVFRQQAAEGVRAFQPPTSPAGTSSGPELTAARQAVATFITSPKSLTVVLSPKTPVPLMALGQASRAPDQTAAYVGLSVIANAP